MKRSTAALVAALTLSAKAADAQDSSITRPICMKAAAAPACSAILLTNFGIHGLGGGAEASGVGLRVLADWGLLVNTGRHAAVGASWLLSADRDGLLTGPMVRVRLWRNDSTSLEIGLGHGVAQGEDNSLGTFGLVKWNPAPSVGLSLRPEWRRHVSYDCGTPPLYQCIPVTRGAFALSAGVELGGVAGLVGTLTSVAAGFALLVAFLSSDD